jgi:hypothetical protein
MRHLTLIGIAALALTGCPDPGGEGGSLLIGTWDELPSFAGDDEGGSVTFRADGTFEVIDDEPVSGTFEADATTLILTTDEGVEELPYATDGELFTPMALRRVNDGAGFAGEWRAEGLSNGEPQAIELVLASDSTFQLDLGDDLLTGSWREVGGALITTLEIPDNDGNIIPFDMPWHSIEDAVSLFAYERR